MSSDVRLVALSDSPLSLEAHTTAVTRASAGAVSTFVGLVRDHDPSVEGEVTHLEYSAHPDADAVLQSIVRECSSRAGDSVLFAVTHRLGLLAVGDVAIIAAASAPHRAEAFAACSDLVETVKAQLPVWKREILADGSHTWVGIR